MQKYITFQQTEIIAVPGFIYSLMSARKVEALYGSQLEP